jgi:hypothetical protein
LESAANDLVIVKNKILINIPGFEVQTQIFSDHMPIALKLLFSGVNLAHREMALLPKMNWKQYCHTYRSRFREREILENFN